MLLLKFDRKNTMTLSLSYVIETTDRFGVITLFSIVEC